MHAFGGTPYTVTPGTATGKGLYTGLLKEGGVLRTSIISFIDILDYLE